jgi:hypothetical protein
MNDDAKSWDRFTRTVHTVTASSLAYQDLRSLDAGSAARAPSETFIALAASSEAPRERVELRNARRNLAIILNHAEGGVEVEIAASGFASIREWRGANGLLAFENAGISSTVVFDDQGRATKFFAGADIAVLARDAVSLDRI